MEEPSLSERKARSPAGKTEAEKSLVTEGSDGLVGGIPADGVVVMENGVAVMAMASALSMMANPSDLSVMANPSDFSVMTMEFEKHRESKISWADENLGGNERVLVTVPLLLRSQAANLSLDAPKQPAFGLVRVEFVRAGLVRVEFVRVERRDLGRHSVCFFVKRKERFGSVFPTTVRLVCLTVRLACLTVRLVCLTVRLVCLTVRLVCLTVRLVYLTVRLVYLTVRLVYPTVRLVYPTVRLVYPTNHPRGGGFHRHCFVLGSMEYPLGSTEYPLGSTECPLGSMERCLCSVRCWCLSALHYRFVASALHYRVAVSALYYQVVDSEVSAFFLCVEAYCGEFVCVVGVEREVGFVCGVVGG